VWQRRRCTKDDCRFSFFATGTLERLPHKRFHNQRKSPSYVVTAIQPSNRVHDRDDAAPDDAIVVNHPSMSSSERGVESHDCTLAEDTPDYPEGSSIVVVCFVEDLVEYDPPSNESGKPTAFGPARESKAMVRCGHNSKRSSRTLPETRYAIFYFSRKQP
jgi:hypothetical protein